MTEIDAQRLAELDRDVVALKVANATLAVNVTNLSSQVSDLNSSVKELTDTINRGKGALWGMTLIAGSAGAGAVTVMKKIFGA